MADYLFKQAEATQAAMRLIAALGSAAASTEIAGSARRGKSMMKDVEIVIRPAYIDEQVGLGFLEPKKVNTLQARIVELAASGVIKPRKNRNGSNIAWIGTSDSRYIAAYFEGVPVDLFIVLADRELWYGATLWLRTGPGEANRLMVTPPPNGLCPVGVQLTDGKVYRYGRELPCPTEEDMFAALELDFVEPHMRCESTYRQARATWLAKKKNSSLKLNIK